MRSSYHLGVVALIIGLLFPAVASAESVVERDRERIRTHLERVEAELRAKDVSHLSPEERRARERNLDRLHAYWKDGEFPRNDVTDERTPIFIDRDGRECAVGYLMVESGWDEEAEAIAERENLKRLPNMTSPEVADWLEQSGLTAEEATRIQPSYSPCRNCDCTGDPVCGSDGNTYVNECTATKCANVETVNDGCCTTGDDPITPEETDDSWGNCYNQPDTGTPGGSSDAGDAGPDAGGPKTCSMEETTETPDPPPESACTTNGGDRSPLAPGWLLLLIGAAVLRWRRR